MKYLITDLDFTLILPKNPASQRPCVNNWKPNPTLQNTFLSSFIKIFIVTNQADHRINLSYIDEVVKYYKRGLSQKSSSSTNVSPAIIPIINKNRDMYRKPHVMSFIKFILPNIEKNATLVWIGDQEDDFKFYSNCLLHLNGITNDCKFFKITDLNTSVKPISVKNTFTNDPVIKFSNNSIIIIYMYLLDMKSTFLSLYKTFQIIKEYKNYYLLHDKDSNVKIYIGRINSSTFAKKKIDRSYILNSSLDTERIARYFEYVTYTSYVKHSLETFYKKLDIRTLDVIKMYPNIQNEKNMLYFLEVF